MGEYIPLVRGQLGCLQECILPYKNNNNFNNNNFQIQNIIIIDAPDLTRLDAPASDAWSEAWRAKI